MVGIIEEGLDLKNLKFYDFINKARCINFKNDWNLNKNVTSYNYILKANSKVSLRT